MESQSNLKTIEEKIKAHREKVPTTSRGIAGVHIPKNLKDEWLTPPHILKALGNFDLDPCSPINRPWPTANNHLTIKDDGLKREWEGRVWLNPPYGTQTHKWLKKLKEHGKGTALIFARTETKMFFDHVWHDCSALLFIEGRLFFHHVSGEAADHNSGAPSVLVAYGQEDADRLSESGLKGFFIRFYR